MINYLCPICPTMFNTPEELDTHVALAHAGESVTYFCPFCGMEYSSRWELDSHIVSDHPSMLPTTFESFVPPDMWMPPTDDWRDWMPHEHYAPPPEWVPDTHWRPPDDWWGEGMAPFEGWMPPLDWVPPPEFMQNVVPPWMSEESWIRPEDWMPCKDWVPPEMWRPPEFHPYFCFECGLEFTSPAELDAHIASAHPEITPVFPCPFDEEVFSSMAEMEAYIEANYAGRIPTLDEINEILVYLWVFAKVY